MIQAASVFSSLQPCAGVKCCPAVCRSLVGTLLLSVGLSTAHAADTGNSAAAGSQAPGEARPQWYTGSLVSPSGALSKAGVFAWEPYVSYNLPVGYLDANGNSHPLHPRQQSVSNFTLYKYSITDSISIQVTPTISYLWKKKAGTSSGLKFGDLPVDLMWRYLDADPARYIPALSVFAGVGFPTGNYQRLGRAEDGVGSGVYTFRLAFTEQSTYTLPGQHELRLRMWGTFRRALTTAHLHNVSSYGTEVGFRGTAQPGMYGESGFSLEFGINQKWVLAMDLARDWADGSHIKGRTPTSGKIERIDRINSSSGDWLIAPAVEYNWSPVLG